MVNPLPLNPKPRLDSETISLASEIDRLLAQIQGLCENLPFETAVFDLLQKTEAVESFYIDNYIENFSSVAEYFYSPELFNENLARYYSAVELGNKLLKNISQASHIIKSLHFELIGKKSTDSKIDSNLRLGSAWLDEKQGAMRNSKFIFPNPDEITPLMKNLDDYIAMDISYPVVINAAIIHGQLELIHPFNSMNGLVGRLLFHLHLKWKNRLELPVLQFSNSLNAKKVEYFDRLEDLDKNNNWDGWIKFFVRSVNDAALNTRKKMKDIFLLRHNNIAELNRKELITTSFLTVYNHLYKNPVVTVPFLTKELNYSKQTVNVLVSKLLEENILAETTGQRRYRVYEFKKLIDILNQG